jgi:hypothetical protein
VNSVLSGGRKPRRRHRTLAHHLWLVTAALAGVIAAALIAIRI